jgi:hypothetical protein
MVRATETLESQLNLYESQSDSWRADRHETALAELRQVVAFANFLYDRIKRVDEEWSAEVATAGTAPLEADARAVEALYAKWCAKAEVDLRRAAEVEAAGHRVEGMDRFRQAYYEARANLSIPTDRVLQSTAHAREGRARPLGEVRDELRRQTNA